MLPLSFWIVVSQGIWAHIIRHWSTSCRNFALECTWLGNRNNTTHKTFDEGDVNYTPFYCRVPRQLSTYDRTHGRHCAEISALKRAWLGNRNTTAHKAFNEGDTPFTPLHCCVPRQLRTHDKTNRQHSAEILHWNAHDCEFLTTLFTKYSVRGMLLLYLYIVVSQGSSAHTTQIMVNTVQKFCTEIHLIMKS